MKKIPTFIYVTISRKKNIKLKYSFHHFVMLVLLHFLPGMSSSVYAQCDGVSDPAPVITTDTDLACTLLDDDDEPIIIPGNCWMVCSGGFATYSTPNVNGNTYTWSVSGPGNVQFIPSGNMVSVNWDLQGAGTVQVTETNGSGCSITVEHCITIVPAPDVFFSTVPTNESQTGIPLNICNGQTVWFYGHIKQTGIQSPISSWYWNFDDPTTGINNISTLPEPFHDFSGPGQYNVCVTVTNECGCSDMECMLIVVDVSVAANIECPSPVCEGAYDTYVTNAVCSTYTWTIEPPGAGVFSPVPCNTCTSATVHWIDGSAGQGILSVTGTGCNTNCPNTSSIVIPIISPDNMINGPSIVCADAYTEFTTANLPGSTYNWLVNGATTGIVSGQGTNSIIVHWTQVCTAPCAAVISLNYSNAFLGCPPGSNTLNVQIKNTFEISGDASVCAGSDIIFNTTPADNFDWIILDAGGNTIITYSNTGSPLTIPGGALLPGNYTLQVIDIQNKYCEIEQFFSFIVNAPPAPPAGTITGQDWICENDFYSYSFAPPYNSSNAYLVWSITGGTPATATGNTAHIQWLSGGTYGIDIRVYNTQTGCLSDPLHKTINLKQEVPITDFDIQGDRIVCRNSITSYTIDNSLWPALLNNADQIEWSIHLSDQLWGSITSGQGTQAITVQWNNNTPDATAITLSIKVNVCGIVHTYNFIDLVVVYSKKEYVITAVPNPVCDLNTVQFTATVQLPFTNVSPIYSWNMGNGTIINGSNPLTYSYLWGGSGSTSYDVTLNVKDDGCDTDVLLAYSVIVEPTPIIEITPSAPCYDVAAITLTSTVQPGLTVVNYLWSTGATTAAITINSGGIYTVTVTAASGCTSSSEIIIPVCDDCIENASILHFNWTRDICAAVTFNVDVNSNGFLPYYWSFGDGNNTVTSNNQVVHTYSAAGIHEACVKVIDIATGDDYCWCEDVEIPLDVSFEYSFACPGPSGNYLLNLTSGSNYIGSAPSLIYTWSGFPGGPVSGQNLTQIQLDLPANIYTILLTVSDGLNATCAAQQNISVPAPPFPPSGFDISPDPENFCEKQTPVHFTFIGNQGVVASALWDFGDLTSSTIFPQTDRVYGDVFQQTNYGVTLTITDIFGCLYNSTGTVTINDNVLTGQIDATPNPACPGEPVEVEFTSNLVLPNLTYLWNNGSTSNPISVFEAGLYWVTVTETTTGCTYFPSGPGNFEIHNLPYLLLNGETSYCSGQDISLSCNLTGNYNYQWASTPPGMIFLPNSTGCSITVVTTGIPVPSTYIVTLTVNDPANGCDFSKSETVVINPLPPSPDLDLSSPACEGVENSIMAQGAVAPYMLTWSNNMIGNPISVYTAGAFIATLTDPASGCSSSDMEIVHNGPDLNWVMYGCFEYCSNNHGAPVVITIPGNNISPQFTYASWQWTIQWSGGTAMWPLSPGTNSNVTDFTLNEAITGNPAGVLPPGAYIITLKAADDDGCSAISRELVITVVECPCQIVDILDESSCIGTDIFGNLIIQYDFTITFNTNLNQAGQFALSSVPLGAIQPWSNTIILPNMAHLTGIYYVSPGNQICIDISYIDPDPLNSCTYTYCPIPKNCPPSEKCSFDFPLPLITCIGTDVSGNPIFSLQYQNLNFGGTVWTTFASSNAGTISGFPAVINSNPFSFTCNFTYIPGNNDVPVCIHLVLYDPVSETSCFLRHCFELPNCPARFSQPQPEASVQQPVTSGSLQLIPNPASEKLMVRFELESETGSLILRSMDGTVIQKAALTIKNGFFNYDVSKLNPGIYLVDLSGISGERIIKKLVVINN